MAFWLVNKDWWDGLPEDVRTALQAAADNTIGWSWKEAKSKSDEFLQKARDAGINVVDLSDERMSAAKQIVCENEWPAMESVVGTNPGLGNVSPSCTTVLYMAAGISKLSLDKYFVPTMKLLCPGHLPMVLIVTFIPDLSLALPRLVMGIE